MRSAAELAYRRTATYRKVMRRELISRLWPLLMAGAGFVAGVIIALH